MRTFSRFPSITAALAVSLATVATFTACEDTSEPTPAADCDALRATAYAALENELYRLSQLPDPPSGPSDIHFSEAEDAYAEALACDPANGEAILGAGLTGFLAVTQDPQIVDAWDRWETFVDTVQVFHRDIVPTRAGGTPGDPGAALPAGFDGLNPEISDLFRMTVGLVAGSFVDPHQVEDLQSLVETEILPRLSLAMDRLDTVLDQADFSFPISGKMQGDLAASDLELDLTEVHALLAAGTALRAMCELAVSYSLNLESYDCTGMETALTQDSGFLALREGGAARMAGIEGRLRDVLDQIEEGIAYLRAETDPQDDDLIVIDSGDGPTEADLDQLLADIDSVRADLDAPFTVRADFDDNGTREDLTIDPAAFFANAPENLKALIPGYSVAVDEIMVAGGFECCPVIAWDAATYAEWTFPDPTLAGLFPEFTTSEELKTFFGLDSQFGGKGDWNQEMRFCEVVEADGYVYVSPGDGAGWTPIPGALISTSLDDRTAVADEVGHFHLVTTASTDPYLSQPFTITVSADGYQTYEQNQVWEGSLEDAQFFLLPAIDRVASGSSGFQPIHVTR
jgi:hypothetical protein